MMQLTSEKEKELDNILILKKFIATSLPNPRECVYNLIIRRDDGEITLRFKKKKSTFVSHTVHTVYINDNSNIINIFKYRSLFKKK